MNKDLFFTGFQCYTVEEAEKFFRDKVSLLNWEIVLGHLTVPELAHEIVGFIEQDGSIYFFLEDDTIRVSQNLKHPRFGN